MDEAVTKAGCSDSRMRKPSPEVVSAEYDFCDAPTVEEVEAAAKELQSTIINTGNGGQPESPVVVITEVTRTDTNTDASEEKKMEEKSTSQLAVCLKADSPVVSSQSRASLVQCVDMFQRDPQVQEAVMSLARDPALWNAFVRNEKVQELLRERRRSTLNGSSLALLDHHTNPFIVAVHCLKSTLWDVLDSFVDVVHGVFGFIDRKLFGGRESNPLDSPLKASMVLAILLLSLVLLRRPTSAAGF